MFGGMNVASHMAHAEPFTEFRDVRRIVIGIIAQMMMHMRNDNVAHANTIAGTIMLCVLFSKHRGGDKHRR